MRPWHAPPLLALCSCSLLNLFSAPAVDSTDCSPVLTLYRDADGDGYGVTSNTRLGCGPIHGWSLNSGDCNDAPGVGANFHPQAIERCDRVDQDCSNGGRDESAEDNDRDGHAPTNSLCEGGDLPKDDCDDERDDVHRGLAERCDLRDNNCDGLVDEEPVADVACQGPSALFAVCRSGACIVTCERRRGDCDRDPDNGCERDLLLDPSHCGGCGMRCGAGSTCVDGFCRGRIVQVAVGREANRDAGGGVLSHSCAVRSSVDHQVGGLLLCWGSNQWGQLGLPTASLTGSREPVPVELPSRPIAVAAGATSTCAIVGDERRVICWGAPNAQAPAEEVHEVFGIAGVTQLAMTATLDGHDAACLITAAGELYCWGANPHGNLGVGTTSFVATPTRVELPAPAVEVGMAPMHSCARTARSVYCWGRNLDGELGDGTTTARLRPTLSYSPPETDELAQLVVGDRFSCASARFGLRSPELRCWGNNARNLFGLETLGTPPRFPTTVTAPALVPTRGSSSALLAAGDGRWCTGHSETVTPVGDATVRLNDVLCAGALFYRQAELAVEYREFQALSPVASLRKLRSLALGQEHACGLQDDAQVVCWGENAAGQCGDGSNSRRRSPRIVTALNARVRVIGSTYDFLTLGADGVVGSRSSVTRARFFGRTVRDIAVDQDGSAAFIEPTGNLYYTGFTGTGAPLNLRSDIGVLRVVFSGHATATHVSTACALTAAGGVRCHRLLRRIEEAAPSWSSDTTGFVGLSGAPLGARFCGWTPRGEASCWDATEAPTPTRLPAAENDVAAISLETRRDCWLRSNGRVSCRPLDRAETVPVAPELDDGIQIVSGAEHTCVLRRTGRVACFGANGFGQLGDGTSTDRAVAVEVRGLEDAEQVFAGMQYTCARRQTGGVVCWGRNSSGQLDDGTLIDRYVPTPTLQVP